MNYAKNSVTVSGNDLDAQLKELAIQYPEFYDAIDLEKFNTWQKEVRSNIQFDDDFGPSGRGVEYVEAQQLNAQARSVGIKSLVDLALQRISTPGDRKILVDLLGGDGLIRRVCSQFNLSNLSVLTCDLSPHMISSAWLQGTPALLQSAEKPILKESSVDIVLLAYGSHHIPQEKRQSLAAEAYRILRPGGVFVLHDFLRGSAEERWFQEIVHPYSITGHNFQHFTYGEVEGYFQSAGFTDCNIIDLKDPYTATGFSPIEAKASLGEYLVKMYGLSRAYNGNAHQTYLWATEKAELIFNQRDEPTVSASRRDDNLAGDPWRISIPRSALVGVGRKSSA